MEGRGGERRKGKINPFPLHIPDHTSPFKSCDDVFVSCATFSHMEGFVNKREEKHSKCKVNASTLSLAVDSEPVICQCGN